LFFHYSYYCLLATSLIIPVTADPSLVATSNGYRMSEHELAGTSKPPSGAPRAAPWCSGQRLM
jgi:hypothetical protein